MQKSISAMKEKVEDRSSKSQITYMVFWFDRFTQKDHKVECFKYPLMNHPLRLVASKCRT